MSRAGREPAEDVKRRLIAACQEVGLVISSAHMHLMREHALRLINVGASIPNWPQETPMLTVMAQVGISGQWPETVDIRCTSSTDSEFSFNDCWMKGRHESPFQDLIDELTQTLKEREQVLALLREGVSSPYVFEHTVWDRFDPLKGLDAI